MKSSHRLAFLLFLGVLQAPAVAADPAPPASGLDIPAPPEISQPDNPPAGTDSVPSPPYGTDAVSPGSAATTDGNAGPGGTTVPPGASPRNGASPGGLPAAIPPIFLQLDTNKDGFVERDEARRSADTTARFEELDIDHDGRLSPAELKAGEAAVPGR